MMQQCRKDCDCINSPSVVSIYSDWYSGIMVEFYCLVKFVFTYSKNKTKGEYIPIITAVTERLSRTFTLCLFNITEIK